MKFRKGQYVEWKWGSGSARGKVTDHFEAKVTRTLDGTQVTRNADADNPAYLIEQDDGAKVLKSQSELSAPD